MGRRGYFGPLAVHMGFKLRKCLVSLDCKPSILFSSLFNKVRVLKVHWKEAAQIACSNCSFFFLPKPAPLFALRKLLVFSHSSASFVLISPNALIS